MKDQMNRRYQSRIKRVQSQLASENAALLLSAPDPIRQSRGVMHPFRQESDILYLTGYPGAQLTLLILPGEKSPIFIVPATDKTKILWEGAELDIRPIARDLSAQVITSTNIEAEIKSRLKGVDRLYYQARNHSRGYRVAASLFALDSYVRGAFPSQFVAADKLLAPLRLIKCPEEVTLMIKAAEITTEALFAVAPLISTGSSEAEIKETLEYVFRSCGGEVAFETIVAAGKNAAVLHYHQSESKLRKGQMVLLDCGASLGGYASDISRTIPVNGEFEVNQLQVYQTVLAAQKAAIKAVKPGVLMAVPYKAAALELIEGLKEIGVLKGSTKELYKSGEFKKYFPHGIGHSLGLDVHDVGELRGNNQALLAEGMVITIEPGLYFSKPFKKLPACGVRIEDNVLVTRNGAKVLTEGFPKEPELVD